MSDGCRDEAIAQERYFERMRSRLLEEEALYGAWNPETCPNIIRGEDDWCACGRPCRAMWCEGCNAHLGPWGAWRATVAQIETVDDYLGAVFHLPPRMPDDRIVEPRAWDWQDAIPTIAVKGAP